MVVPFYRSGLPLWQYPDISAPCKEEKNINEETQNLRSFAQEIHFSCNVFLHNHSYVECITGDAGGKTCPICKDQFISQMQKNVLQFLLSDVVTTTRVLPSSNEASCSPLPQRNFWSSLKNSWCDWFDCSFHVPQDRGSSLSILLLPLSWNRSSGAIHVWAAHAWYLSFFFLNDMLLQLKLETITAVLKVKKLWTFCRRCSQKCCTFDLLQWKCSACKHLLGRRTKPSAMIWSHAVVLLSSSCHKKATSCKKKTPTRWRFLHWVIFVAPLDGVFCEISTCPHARWHFKLEITYALVLEGVFSWT
jgi:hypothetical protein